MVTLIILARYGGLMHRLKLLEYFSILETTFSNYFWGHRGLSAESCLRDRKVEASKITSTKDSPYEGISRMFNRVESNVSSLEKCPLPQLTRTENYKVRLETTLVYLQNGKSI
ncbi:hypothetical protein AVEN_172242-1 [Araneus ventricosus]|uniref:Uncharacterized protein n=1 Tax=Araneus ventricosus TaxID=182803 RepID=A0A4Y2G3V1_ARAVE|nr:hypothetical protein AVEN_172242-1 [Araneus ventricosus]